MKNVNKFLAGRWLLILSIGMFVMTGCQKIDSYKVKDYHNVLKQTYDYPSDVAIKWMDMQLRLLRANPTPFDGLTPGRFFGYCGIALYESVLPGMPYYRTLSGQLNGMPPMPRMPVVPGRPPVPSMPGTPPAFEFHWPTCANTALAYMNRNFFPDAAPASKKSLDSLENALNTVYQHEVTTEVFQRSLDFGKAVAQLIFNWSETDGAHTPYLPYLPPAGQGLWIPTAPSFSPAASPYWGYNRLLVHGSLDGFDPPPPPAYSTNPTSDLYKMVKEVYDISQHLTTEQKEIGLYYRDNPGYGDGHYLSILMQILQQKGSKLDVAALAYARAGIACIDAAIGCWQIKYRYNAETPVTYITGVMKQPSWTPLFSTPSCPEYVSWHSAVGGAFAAIMTDNFGPNCDFFDRTYDYLDMRPRYFNSLRDLANEISISGVYAGINYRGSCERGLAAGEKIGHNIGKILTFQK